MSSHSRPAAFGKLLEHFLSRSVTLIETSRASIALLFRIKSACSEAFEPTTGPQNRQETTMTPVHTSALTVLAAITLACAPSSITAQSLTPHQQLARDIFKELVEINTVTPTGDTLHAAEAMAARLQGGGLPRRRRAGARARRRARAISSRGCAAPAHASRSCCSRTSTSSRPSARTGRSIRSRSLEKDGYFYGRGTGDDKCMAAAFVANLIRYKQEGYHARPRPDPRADGRRGERRRATVWHPLAARRTTAT